MVDEIPKVLLLIAEIGVDGTLMLGTRLVMHKY